MTKAVQRWMVYPICRESIKYLWLEWWMLHNPLTNPRMYGSISGLSRNA
ncbi:TPA: hypothetical protein KN082_000069 [Clostridioides difficile]|nr:hypothetical protein [Clostridioides difficile]MBH6986714.1 hypothetical protein [Clostridioides difficile]MBH7139366.1 hypothetical protein [Clostridioides difficile]MBY1993324.1 hypothetical protein [Clostridioides difficile]MBY2145002.1 hypothetical protein [Clostridioides difficile]MBY2820793.1 hypothetical protein [Clostridioides difficile]